MMKVEVVLKDGYFGNPHEGWIPAEVAKGDLINVLWHPIDGPTGAVVMPWGEIEFYGLNKIAVIDQ